MAKSLPSAPPLSANSASANIAVKRAAVERGERVTATAALELWGGVECTVNRVGDRFHDQLELSGHAGPRGLQDLERFAALGIRALRYPLLWERLAPEAHGRVADWSWADTRLGRLRELGIRPIVGLIHHGSGPRHTHLLDPAFPSGLADYARQAAERFPWVEDSTPVNEPLTTARFSALYGHWYPHVSDHGSFVRALLHQLRGVVLSMRAIREINPRARLVQTEDLGKTFSTRALGYQAEFENQRRWLTFDLLCGRVDSAHPMWGYLRGADVSSEDLAWFVENATPPDVLGLNHYVTSERFLDERLDRYPGWARSANDSQEYADVCVVRVSTAGAAGPGRLLREVWQRYGLPLAVTEAHLSCSREEQLRWVAEIWQEAQALRAREGVEVRAVTLWSLLGAHDWDSLLTKEARRYEPGVFDLRAPEPRPTALATFARELATHGDSRHPALATPGWRRRRGRFDHPPRRAHQRHTPPAIRRKRNAGPARPLLITGAGGTLGGAFRILCEGRGLLCRPLTRRDLDITDAASVRRVLDKLQPWAVVNAAGYVRVDDAETHDRDRCWRENVEGPVTLAHACARHDVPLVTFSSDLVFNGQAQTPYDESATPCPLNVYGQTKAEAERRVLEILPSALVVRSSAFFGPWDESNFVLIALRALATGEPFAVASAQTVSPTYVPDLVGTCLDLLLDGERGLWHLANSGSPVTWFALAEAAAQMAGIESRGLLHAVPGWELGQQAERPSFSALASHQGFLMPSWQDALGRFGRECVHRWKPATDQPLFGSATGSRAKPVEV